jgi:hypothetical protein
MKGFSASFTLQSDERAEVCNITKVVPDAVQQFHVTTGMRSYRAQAHRLRRT